MGGNLKELSEDYLQFFETYADPDLLTEEMRLSEKLECGIIITYDERIQREMSKQDAILNKMEGNLDIKINNICRFITNEDSDIAGLKQEIKRLEKKVKSKERLIGNLQNYMSNVLYNTHKNAIESGKRKYETQNGEYKLSFRGSELCEIFDELQLPDIYKTQETTVKIDKNFIKSNIKLGIDVPGARIIAKKNLSIK